MCGVKPECGRRTVWHLFVQLIGQVVGTGVVLLILDAPRLGDSSAEGHEQNFVRRGESPMIVFVEEQYATFIRANLNEVNEGWTPPAAIESYGGGGAFQGPVAFLGDEDGYTDGRGAGVTVVIFRRGRRLGRGYEIYLVCAVLCNLRQQHGCDADSGIFLPAWPTLVRPVHLLLLCAGPLCGALIRVISAV